ncbi:MAG: hypothetical protein IPI67_13165 [Myxococcales bacterium]|nr:hypothetical protein [Myxococcales bacterium]
MGGPMVHGGSMWLGIPCFVLLACSEPEVMPAAEPPVVPGSCLATDCTLPKREPLTPGPLVDCEPVQAKAVVEWKTKNGTLPCPYGSCPVIGEDLTLGSDGSLWVSAWLLHPIQYPMPEPHERAGFALLRFGPTGDECLAIAADVAVGLGSILERTRGIRASGAGLSWIGPGHGATGIWWRRHGARGDLTSARWLVQDALSSHTHLRANHAVVGYSYVESVDHDAQPPVATRRAGVARFTSDGRLSWNQSALSSLTVDRMELVGGDSDGSTTFQLRLVPEFGKAAPILIVRVAPDGRLVWTREVPTPMASATAGPDGTTYVSQYLDNGGESFQALDALDRDGKSLWRARLPMSFGLNDLVAVDSNGRALVAQDVSFPQPKSLLVQVSTDGSRCVQYQLEASFMLRSGDISMGDTPRVVALPDGRVAFATVAEIGIAQLPEVP